MGCGCIRQPVHTAQLSTHMCAYLNVSVYTFPNAQACGCLVRSTWRGMCSTHRNPCQRAVSICIHGHVHMHVYRCVHGHVYRHVHRQVCGQLYRHVYRHVHRSEHRRVHALPPSLMPHPHPHSQPHPQPNPHHATMLRHGAARHATPWNHTAHKTCIGVAMCLCAHVCTHAVTQADGWTCVWTFTCTWV